MNFGMKLHFKPPRQERPPDSIIIDSLALLRVGHRKPIGTSAPAPSRYIIFRFACDKLQRTTTAPICDFSRDRCSFCHTSAFFFLSLYFCMSVFDLSIHMYIWLDVLVIIQNRIWLTDFL